MDDFCEPTKAVWIRSRVGLPIPRAHFIHATRLLSLENLREEISMTSPISPSSLSEFETEEQETSYTAWLRAKAQASLDDPRPSVPHENVMAEARTLLTSKKEVRANN